MYQAILSLGTNLDDRKKNIETMIDRLRMVLIQPLLFSRLMETEPLEVNDNQPWYYNCLLSGWFNDSAQRLLQQCECIEHSLGRTRKLTKESRLADIDIMFAGDSVITTSTLIIPHPQLLRRRFCIEGIYEIAPQLIHPVTLKSFYEIFKTMDESVRLQKIRFLDL
ncbi:MAG: 2-amino-4-hydroxy-6-hydroxymethyldihydropteridine diphosphokinase [Chitinivibrionales bacterium]|nr:2-amino-4-hydroxy-6-hydroxymethyldihydropteridine diphosphokinase [Chitinivibrionales bacterium]